MAFVGQEHSGEAVLFTLGLNFTLLNFLGIDDARNTAKLCYRMVRDGCKLNITKSIDNKVPCSGVARYGLPKHF